jgi:hypothetical protein
VRVYSGIKYVSIHRNCGAAMREVSNGFFVICDECKSVPFHRSDKQHVQIQKDGFFLQVGLMLRKLRRALSSFASFVMSGGRRLRDE